MQSIELDLKTCDHFLVDVTAVLNKQPPISGSEIRPLCKAYSDAVTDADFAFEEFRTRLLALIEEHRDKFAGDDAAELIKRRRPVSSRNRR